MILKILGGIIVGGGAGYGYHLLMRACNSQCINRKKPAVPIIGLAVIGGIVAAYVFRGQ